MRCVQHSRAGCELEMVGIIGKGGYPHLQENGDLG